MAATSQKKEKFEDYEGFVEKFKPKLTTDDCYTPPAVYDALVEWVDREIMPLEGKKILRPFWPGADFTAVEYGPEDVVIDNPPFSIVSKIARWYAEQGIKYFLFAPALTLFSSPAPDESYICAHCEIIYENGAVVRTSFRTNMLGGRPKVSVRGDLFQLIKEVQEATRDKKQQRKLLYPDMVISSAHLGRLCVRGIRLDFQPEDVSEKIGRLDCGLNIFGGGFLLSERAAAERAAAERAAAERAAAERAAAERAVLSDREWAIIRGLGGPKKLKTEN